MCNEFTQELLADLPSQGRDFVIAGMVSSTRRLTTRDGRGFIAATLEDLSGSIEVTVWPDIYDRTPDLWVTGRIVLAQVRVRERGDRVSAGVQEVVPFSDDFVAPPWVEIRAAAIADGRANGNGHSNGHNGDHLAATDEVPFGRPQPIEGRADEALLSVRPELVEGRLDEAPIIDDLGFYEEPPVGEPAMIQEEPAAYAPAPPAGEAWQAPPSSPPAPFALVLEETPDEAADQKKLAGLFKLLQAHPGNDPVLLTIRTREQETIELSLPSAALDDALRTQLLEAVGLVVEPVLS
jgi:hypothetical protein